MKKKYKFENILLAVSIIGLIICFLGCVYLMYSRTVNLWRNAIGVLYLEDEEMAGEYIYALFEDISEENIQASKSAFIEFGYSYNGLYYMASSAGIIEDCVGILLLSLLFVLLVIYATYHKRKKTEEEKEQLMLKLAELEEIKAWDEYLDKHNKRIQHFIENISHQIKTPISRVYSSLYLIEDDLEDEEKREKIRECYAHLESVSGLMKRLMDIGRLEAGKVIFKKTRIDFREILEDAARSSGGDNERVKILFEIDENKEFFGDYQWLREGFINIISNALEHDKSGKNLIIECKNDSDNIRISIRDYGSGISEKDIPNIFDRFYMPEEMKANHTGIGLNLAKLIFEGHMGSVYVYNHIDGGAVFNIVLPLYSLKAGKYMKY